MEGNPTHGLVMLSLAIIEKTQRLKRDCVPFACVIVRHIGNNTYRLALERRISLLLPCILLPDHILSSCRVALPEKNIVDLNMSVVDFDGEWDGQFRYLFRMKIDEEVVSHAAT